MAENKGLLTEIGQVEIRMPTGLPRQFIGTDSAQVVLAKILEVVEGARLTDGFTELCLEYNRLTMEKILELLKEYGDKPIHGSSVKGWVAQAYRLGRAAQLQVIIKAFKEV